METLELKEQFEQVLNELKGIDGLTSETAVQVAQVILHESGKDRRTELLRESKVDYKSYQCGQGSSKGSQPATLRQKNALTNFGIKFRDEITKADASELLDTAFEQLDKRQNDVY